MEDESQENKPMSAFLRYRSPTFSKDEVKTLLSLIEGCKSVVLDKSTCTAACQAKEDAWFKITRAFNSKGFKHERSVESLKMKWDNLKKVAKRLSKNVFDMSQNELDDVTSRTVEMLCEAENMKTGLEKPIGPDKVLNGTEEQKEPDWCVEEEDSHDNADSEYKRSLNFSPQECSLLIQCVKQEKKFVLNKANTSNANKLKNRAWFRITNNYNKLSPQKRTTKVLRTKFTNMKRMAKCVNFKNYNKKTKHKLIDDDGDDKKIKSEPIYDEQSEPEVEDIDDYLSDGNEISQNNLNLIQDPLSTTVNGSSGIDLINPIENKEIIRLKTELLNYKMETAKLERRRIEEALQAQAIETSLRLRTARLEALAAAMKMPSNHPALAFTAEELPAEQYLRQCT